VSSFDQLSKRAKKLENQGQIDEAIKLYEQFLQDFPKNTRAKAALEKLRKGVPVSVKTPQDLYTVAKKQIDQGDVKRGIAILEQLVKDVPGYVSAWNMLGMAYFQIKNTIDAERCLRKALEIDRNYVLAWGNIAVLFHSQGKLDNAITAFQNAIILEPDNVGFHSSISGILSSLGRYDEAEKACIRAIKLNPSFFGSYINFANVLYAQQKFLAAKQAVEQALQLNSAYSSGVTQYLYLRAKLCDWSELPLGFETFDTIGTPGNSVSPFSTLTHEDDPLRQLRRSEVRALDYDIFKTYPSFSHPEKRPEKLKIGYFSADFHNHATLSLMMGLFAAHDAEKFEIQAYSYGKVTEGERRNQLHQMVDKFWEVQDRSDEEIVKHAREQGIDIAIDLKGYTQEARTFLFAHRLAPIQINYVGYPGTMGSNFIDYLIADHTIIPEQFRNCYSENIIYMPHSYQPNDSDRKFEENTQSRHDLGLPETGFVFCCFNANYKISPREFDIWMRLLDKVEGSVLWLLRPNTWAEENLRNEASAHGINPDRLIFADRVSEKKHLGRQKHGDLFLDCFNVNAHTTASDALWAGLPLVTKVGKQFAARVAASVLNAANLPELIAETEEEYEAIALDLALHPQKAAALKAKVAENVKTCPLFDSKSYTLDLERGYEAAYERYLRNQSPADIDLASS